MELDIDRLGKAYIIEELVKGNVTLPVFRLSKKGRKFARKFYKKNEIFSQAVDLPMPRFKKDWKKVVDKLGNTRQIQNNFAYLNGRICEDMFKLSSSGLGFNPFYPNDLDMMSELLGMYVTENIMIKMFKRPVEEECFDDDKMAQKINDIFTRIFEKGSK